MSGARRGAACLILLLLGGLASPAQEITTPPEGTKPKDQLDAVILAQIRNLESDKTERRVEAARFFVRNPDPRAFEALRRHIDFNAEKSTDVRVDSVRALAELGNKDAFQPLMTALEKDPEDAVKWVVVLAIGQVNDPRGFDLLREWIETDEHPEWRNLAAYGIGLSRDKRALTILAATLANPEYRVRRDSARGLSALGDHEGCAILLSRMKLETSGNVMREMIRSLGQLGCEDAPALFEELKKKLDLTKGEFRGINQPMDEVAKKIRAQVESKP